MDKALQFDAGSRPTVDGAAALGPLGLCRQRSCRRCRRRVLRRPKETRGRRCIRIVIDSRNLAIRNTFRVSLRPSSTREPSRPPRMLSSSIRISITEVPIMILSQVHLRKPCYDFSFLYVRRFRGVPRNEPVLPGRRCLPLFTGACHGWSDGRCVQR